MDQILDCKYYTNNKVGEKYIGGNILPIIECSHPNKSIARCNGCKEYEKKSVSPLSSFIKPLETRYSPPAKIKVGITTCPRTDETLTRCVESILKAGFEESDIHIFHDNQPIRQDYKEQGIRQTSSDYTLFGFPNFVRTLTEMLLSSGRTYHKMWDDYAYLVIQDDVELSPYDIKSYLLNDVLFPSPIQNFGMLSLYCSHHYKRRERNHEWVNLDPAEWILYNHPKEKGGRVKWCWSGQAMLFSRESALRFIRNATNKSGFGWYWSNDFDDGKTGLRKIDHVIGSFCNDFNLDIWQLSRSLCDHIGQNSAMWSGQGLGGDRSAWNTIK